MSPGTCANCGQRLGADHHYCSACGQEVLGLDARRLPFLIRKSFAKVTDLDGRLWRSLIALVLRPGFLSREYRVGRRRSYLSPIALFLLANLVFFLAPPLSDFSLSLLEQYAMQPYSPLIAPWVDAVLASTGGSFEALSGKYALRIAELAKLMVIIHVPLLALASLLLTIDKRFFYADHVVACLHYFAFLMLYWTVMELLLTPIAAGFNGLIPGAMRIGALLLFMVPFFYLPFMLRSAFDLSWWRALLSTPVFVLGLYLAHFVFRFLQFVVAFVLIGI